MRTFPYSQGPHPFRCWKGRGESQVLSPPRRRDPTPESEQSLPRSPRLPANALSTWADHTGHTWLARSRDLVFDSRALPPGSADDFPRNPKGSRNQICSYSWRFSVLNPPATLQEAPPGEPQRAITPGPSPQMAPRKRPRFLDPRRQHPARGNDARWGGRAAGTPISANAGPARNTHRWTRA